MVKKSFPTERALDKDWELVNISIEKEGFLTSDGTVDRLRRLEKGFVRSTGNLGSLRTPAFHSILYFRWSTLCVQSEMCFRAPSSFSLVIVY